MPKQRTISPFRPALPFLQKIFHPNPYCQIRGSQFPPPPPIPFYKWGGRGMGVQTMTVDKMRWYKLHFSNYVFEQNILFLYKRLNQRCLLLFDFPWILHFYFYFIFQCFFFRLFSSFFSMFSALLPLTKKTMILDKCHSNMTLIQDCKITV